MGLLYFKNVVLWRRELWLLQLLGVNELLRLELVVFSMLSCETLSLGERRYGTRWLISSVVLRHRGKCCVRHQLRGPAIDTPGLALKSGAWQRGHPCVREWNDLYSNLSTTSQSPSSQKYWLRSDFNSTSGLELHKSASNTECNALASVMLTIA